MSSSITRTSKVTLRDGASLPQFGLGTFLSEVGEAGKAVQMALTDEGYIMVDTAAMYNNEDDIGQALAALKLDRDKYFVVTKLLPDDHGRDKTIAAAKESLKKLQLEYVDLYLIHNPKGKDVLETWNAMLEVKALGLAKAVGVSNFGRAQLEALKETGVEMPEVNQVELHPWQPQNDLIDFHKANQIVTMGYCPLARCKRFGETALKEIAEKLGKTEAQVCIRWSLQMGFVTIPKSVNAGRIKQNAEAVDFVISDEDMAAIAKVDENFKASGSVLNQDMPWAEVC